MEKGHADALVGEQRGGDKRGILEVAGAGGVGEQRVKRKQPAGHAAHGRSLPLGQGNVKAQLSSG